MYNTLGRYGTVCDLDHHLKEQSLWTNVSLSPWIDKRVPLTEKDIFGDTAFSFEKGEKEHETKHYSSGF